jgi:hypothetical protein
LDLKVECRSRALQKPGEREVYWAEVASSQELVLPLLALDLQVLVALVQEVQ